MMHARFDGNQASDLDHERHPFSIASAQLALAPCCPEHASNASRSTDYAVRFFQLDRPDESSGAGDARSRSSAGLDEGVVDRAADRHPKKPAVNAPPGRQ